MYRHNKGQTPFQIRMKRVKPARSTGYRERDFIRKKKNRAKNEVETVTREQSLVIGMLNMQGKSVLGMEDVKRAIEVRDINVMCLVETHVRSEDRDGPKIEGFNTHQLCREGGDKKGGGLAILTREKDVVTYSRYSPTIVNPSLAYVNKERMWVTVESQGGKTAICCVYLGCHNADGRHEEHNKGIYKVVAEEVYTLRGKGFRVVLQGDFNAWVGLDLMQGGIPGNRRKTNSSGEAFKTFLASNSLVHVNGACRVPGDWSTRISEGLWTRHGPDYVSTTVLDYVVVSIEHLDSVLEMFVDQDGDLGGHSDHNMIITRVRDKFLSVLRVSSARTSKPGVNIEEDQDWAEYQKVVENEIQQMGYDDDQVESLEHAVSRIIIKGLESGIGRRQSTVTTTRTYPKRIVKLLKERRAFEKLWKTEKSKFASSCSPTPPDSLVIAAERFKEKGCEVEEEIRAFQRQNRAPVKKLCKMKSKRGRQMFWRYVSRKHHKLEDISALQNKRTGVLHSKPEEISEEILGYLKDIFSAVEEPAGADEGGAEPSEESRLNVEQDHAYARVLPGGSAMPEHDYASETKPHLSAKDRSQTLDKDPGGFLDRDFTVQEVKDMIKSLGNEKAPGHDTIPNEALKNAPKALLDMLTKLYNRVKNKEVAPKSWKNGRLVLIHKKGFTLDPYNYRPLTVLSAVSGLYTKILNQRLAAVVECHGLLGEI